MKVYNAKTGKSEIVKFNKFTRATVGIRFDFFLFRANHNLVNFSGESNIIWLMKKFGIHKRKPRE